MKTAWRGLLPVILMIGTFLAGCGSSATPASGPGRLVIGADLARADIPFFVAMERGLKRGASAVHGKLILDVANQSAQTQATQIRELINKHVSALVLNPVDASAIVPSIIAANTAHIPVVLIATGANGGKVFTLVTSYDYKMAQAAANTIVHFLEKRYGSPKGNVVDIEGLTDTLAGLNRQKGFLSVMSKYPHIHIIATIDGQFAEGPSYTGMKDVLTAHPATSGSNAIAAVFGANDQSAAGAARAIQQSGRYFPSSSSRHIFIVGIDGGPTGLADLKSKQMDVVIAQHVISMAIAAVKYAVTASHGKASPGSVVYWPYTVVTRANLASVKVWGKEFSK